MSTDITFDKENNRYKINGILVSPEALGRARYQKVNNSTEVEMKLQEALQASVNTNTGGTQHQAGYFVDRTPLSYDEASQLILKDQMKQAQKASFTSTPFITKEPTMKHLTTHNNWIIALRNG